MSTILDDILKERISFLLEQIRPENKFQVNQTFRLKAEILQTVDLEMLDKSIIMQKAHLKQSTNVIETDSLFAELEARVAPKTGQKKQIGVVLARKG